MGERKMVSNGVVERGIGMGGQVIGGGLCMK